MAEMPVSPAEWCRRILTALCERGAEGEDAAYLQLLLTCLIDLAPPAEQFDSLLDRYRRDRRVGIAEAATVLQRAWRRATAADSPVMLSLEERLRIAGAWLDQERARAAVVQVQAERVRIDVYGGGHCSLGPLELRHEQAGRTVLRGRLGVEDTPAVERYEVRLRLIGAVLADVPCQPFELFITPRAVVVEGAAGYFQVFTSETLARLAEVAVAQRRHARGESGEGPPAEARASIPQPLPGTRGS